MLVLLGREESLLYPGYSEAKGFMKEINVAKYQSKIFDNYENDLWMEAEKNKFPGFENLNLKLQQVLLRCLAPPVIRQGKVTRVEQTAQDILKMEYFKNVKIENNNV